MDAAPSAGHSPAPPDPAAPRFPIMKINPTDATPPPHAGNPIRIGIAGLGRSGWDIHALTLAGLPGQFRIAAVTDPNPDRCREAAGQFGCRTHPDWQALIADREVDIVVLATPSHLHCEQTLQAIAAGKDVICEKPMASSIEEADRMIQAAHRGGRLLTVFQNNRYMPSFQQVRQVIASGVLGRIVQIRISIHSFARRWDWQTLKEFSGGELNTTGSHFLDQALVLFGPSEPEVFCHMERTLTSGDAEDHVKLILRAPGAPLLDIEISKACACPQNRWHVMGTRGGLTGTVSELAWKFTDFTNLPPRPVDRHPPPDRSYNSEQYDWQEDRWVLPADPPSIHTRFYEDLYLTVRENAPLAITPESALRQIAILEKCRQLCPVA